MAARIRAILHDRDMSGRQLAAAAGIQHATCARLLRGDRDLKVSELQAIAAALNLTIADILGDPPTERRAS